MIKKKQKKNKKKLSTKITLPKAENAQVTSFKGDKLINITIVRDRWINASKKQSI